MKDNEPPEAAWGIYMYKVLLVDDENLLLDSLEIILSLNNIEVFGRNQNKLSKD